MKVLLINPNYRNVYSYGNAKNLTPIFPPMGLAYIAAVLRENNVEVKILEANADDLTYDQLKEEINNYKSDYIGITATTCLIEEANNIAKLCPENATVIVGGIHASSIPIETLRDFLDIDILCIGEGEYTLLDIIRGKDLSKIEGIAYRKENKIIKNPSRPLINDLDKLPFPAKDLLPMHKYFSAGSRKKKIDYILSSRGCPFSCIFCSDHLVHGKKFRARSPENVISEIELLISRGVEEFDFIDDNFTLLPERASKICDLMIEKGLNKKLIWRCSNGIRIDKIDMELLKKMKEAGCYMVSLGIESGNDEILKNMKKGITTSQVRKAVALCKEAGIETRGLFMFGNLGETKETMMDTIRFSKELDLDTATFHITLPFPNTEYFNIIKKEGGIVSAKWRDYIAYGNVTFKYKGLDNPKLLIGLQKKAYRSFYLRPKIIIKNLKQISSFSNMKDLAKKGISIIKLAFKK